MQWNRASRFEFDEKSMETETTTWSNFPNGGKAIVEQLLASEDRNFVLLLLYFFISSLKDPKI